VNLFPIIIDKNYYLVYYDLLYFTIVDGEDVVSHIKSCFDVHNKYFKVNKMFSNEKGSCFTAEALSLIRMMIIIRTAVRYKSSYTHRKKLYFDMFYMSIIPA
jgi:hypothetical protein